MNQRQQHSSDNQRNDSSAGDKDRKVNTTVPSGKNGARDLPHERDEGRDSADAAPRDVMRQAASDLEQGQVDTDLHGVPGVEKVVPAANATAKSVPSARPKGSA